jgi:hypothetical protein
MVYIGTLISLLQNRLTYKPVIMRRHGGNGGVRWDRIFFRTFGTCFLGGGGGDVVNENIHSQDVIINKQLIYISRAVYLKKVSNLWKGHFHYCEIFTI